MELNLDLGHIQQTKQIRRDSPLAMHAINCQMDIIRNKRSMTMLRKLSTKNAPNWQKMRCQQQQSSPVGVSYKRQCQRHWSEQMSHQKQ